MKHIVLVIVVAAVAAFFVPSASPAGSVIRTNQPWLCDGPVDLDFVKVTMTTNTSEALRLRQGCTGRIGRVEVDTWTNDGIKVLNQSVNAAHDLVVESGYITCHAVYGDAHQDGVHVMGGARLTFVGLAIDCPFSNSHFFVAKGGSQATTPTDVVCDGCYLGPHAASHSVLLGTSLRSGVRNSTICPDRTYANGSVFDIVGATDPVNEGNLFPGLC